MDATSTSVTESETAREVPNGCLVGLDLCFSSSVIPSVMIDLGRRRIVRVNEAALKLLGLPEEEVLGRAGRDFFSDVPEEQLPRVRALRGENTVALRSVRTATGVRVMRMHVVPTGIGDVALAQAIDLTDMIEEAESAEREMDELRRLSDALSTIGTRVAHDFRSPLTVIAGFAALLREGVGSLPRGRVDEMLNRIETTALGLATLADSTLEDAHDGSSRGDATSLSARELCDAVERTMTAQLAQAGAVLTISCDVERLPVPTSSLVQPLVNLVSNAIKYRSPDRRLVVDLSLSDVDGGVEIGVVDNGRGLGDDPAALFAPGTRGESAVGTVGSGLGLSFVKASIDAVHGDITCSNRAEGGASFRLFVPIVAVDDPACLRSTAESLLIDLELAAILDASAVPAAVVDIERRVIVRVNRAMVVLVGLPDQELLGRALRDFLDDPSVADALRDENLEGGRPFSSARVGLRTPTGVIPAHVWLAPVRDSVLSIAQIVPESATLNGRWDAAPPASSPDAPVD